MKTLTCALLLLISTFIQAQEQQDIVFKSRFDLESSEAFISQLRIFLKNNNFGDPYTQVFKKPIIIDLGQSIDKAPLDTQNWIMELQSLLRVRFLDSEYRLVIDKLAYSINDFNTEFRPGNSTELRVEYVTNNYVKGLNITADLVSFEVELKQMDSNEPIKFKIELIKPEFHVSPVLRAELPMGWSTAISGNNVELNLESVDLSKIMDKLTENHQLVDIQVNDMLIPQFSVRVGAKEIKFDQKKIMNFFASRKDEMKKGILDLLKARMSERFRNILKDNPKKLLIPRKFEFAGALSGTLETQKLVVNKTGIVQIDLDGDFCGENKSLVKICPVGKIDVKLRRKIENSLFQKSLREMNRNLIENNTNIAFSMSEHYLNQLIEGTIHAGLWEDALKGKDFTLGPEKSFILAEERGELSLYLDIIYKLKGSQRILVGKSELRFPIKFMIDVNIEDINEIPHFVIKVKKIATDHNMLLTGLPLYDLPTTVNTVQRFRSKVLTTIMEEVNTFDQQTLIEFEMKELKGTYLHNLDFFSDGMGRATATLGFKKVEQI